MYLGSIKTPEAFFSRLQNRGVRIWQCVEILPQHAVFIAEYAAFIAQQMLDQILKICKIGFFDIFCPYYFKTNLVIFTITNFFAACEECLKVLMLITKFAK